MRYALLVLFTFTLSFSAIGEDCSPTSLGEVEELVRDVDNICSHNIKLLAEKYILEKCSKAPASAGVRFTNNSPNSLRFTELSYTYDASKPYYFCKNKKGYESYLNNLVQKLNLERHAAERDASRAKHEEFKRRNPNRPVTPVPGPEVKPPEKWICIVPGYVGMPKTVSSAEKRNIELTYSIRCVPERQ